jgi:alkanesulfonate monooxygenase SsuD/methylene tetrahydromethanopterin reductase-like flavin-dependent oxidoreductase (luciferase family)
MIRVGLGILTGQVPPTAGSVADEYRGLLHLAEAAEAYGFDSVWVSEHHFSPDAYLPSVLPVLGAVAAATSRIEMGTAALLAPLHHPLRIAEDAAVVDLLSGGRLTLGLANGWRIAEFHGFGVAPAERSGRLDETVEVLRQAWHAPVRHRGRYFTIDTVDVHPRPSRPIPILLGAFADPAVARAGRIGDGFIASADSVAAVSKRFGLALAAASEAAHPAFRLAVMLDAAFAGTPGAVEGYRYKQEVYRRWRTGTERLPSMSCRRGSPTRCCCTATRRTLPRESPDICHHRRATCDRTFPGCVSAIRSLPSGTSAAK